MNSDSMKQLSKWRLAIAEPLSRFWQWWSGELVELIPMRWRSRGEGSERTLHYTAGAFELGEGQRVPLNKAESDPMLATWRTRTEGRSGLLVTLADEDLLSKTISLPAATQANLSTVLGFELDRHTPFSKDQASFGYRVTARDRSHQRIEVELFVLPNALRTRIISALDAVDLQPTRILPQSVIGDKQFRESLNLLPEIQRHKSPGRRVLRSRPVLIVLLCSLGVGALFYQREQRLLELQEMVGPKQIVAEKAQAIRTELETLESGGRYLYERKLAMPANLVILDELTRLIPDDTWLNRFELEGRELRIQGESSNTSQLIGLLEQASMFTGVSFTSPVTINPRSNKERFSLTATVVGGNEL